jgi:hypothetical protein
MQKLKSFGDYIPFLIIPFVIIADDELEKHAFKVSCNLAITILIYSSFFITCVYFKCSKYIAVIIATLLFFFLTFLKRKYLTNL